MWRVARRPRWIAALILALGVAVAFAALSQWQLTRSISSGEVAERQTETVVPLEDVAVPQSPTTQSANGQLVEVSGTFVPGDYIVLSDRFNGGEQGYWVVGHLVTAEGAGVAVALGWTMSEAEAHSVADSLGAEPAEVVGRYFPSEGPQETDFQSGELSVLSAPAMVNLWSEPDPGGIYGGYLVAGDAVAGLTDIDSPAPAPEIAVNWLNIFYAAEWVIFAGFAVFLWWRLVKDAWEREQGA